MQLSVFFSALLSLVVLAAASPMPGAISKRSLFSAKRGNLDINFQRDLLEESKKREELGDDIVAYVGYGGGGLGPGGRGEAKRENLDINFQRDLLEESKKREELRDETTTYLVYGGEGPDAFGEDNLKKRELQVD